MLFHLFKQARFSCEPFSPFGQRMTIHVEQGSSSPRETFQEFIPKQIAVLKYNKDTAKKRNFVSVKIKIKFQNIEQLKNTHFTKFALYLATYTGMPYSESIRNIEIYCYVKIKITTPIYKYFQKIDVQVFQQPIL